MALIQKFGKAVAMNAAGKPLSSFKDKDGKQLPAKVNYDYSWFEHDTTQSMVDAKEEMSLEDQLKVVNVNRKTTARQAANTAALNAIGFIRPNEQNDSQIRLKTVARGLYAKNISKGMDPETAMAAARAKAAEMLEEEWENDDDDDNGGE